MLTTFLAGSMCVCLTASSSGCSGNRGSWLQARMADKDVQVFEVIFNLFSSQSKTFESQTVAFERLFLFVLCQLRTQPVTQ